MMKKTINNEKNNEILNENSKQSCPIRSQFSANTKKAVHVELAKKCDAMASVTKFFLRFLRHIQLVWQSIYMNNSASFRN